MIRGIGRLVCRMLAAGYGGPEKCALADGPRVTMAQMGSFYHAAARYFRHAPWKHVRGELTNTWDDVCDMLYGLRGSDEISGLSVIYDEVAVMAPADLYLEALTKPPK